MPGLHIDPAREDGRLRRRRRRSAAGPAAHRRGLALGVAAALIAGVAGAFGAVHLRATAALTCPVPNLGNFEVDGNMTVDCPPLLDWSNLGANNVNVNTAVDLPSGTSDNAFGQGAKESLTGVTVVTGSIPPNKNDLTRMYEANQFVSVGGTPTPFVYIAWERAVNIGSADIDFEFNQVDQTSTFTPSTTGPVTITRTNGDLLILFEFSGSGNPTIQAATWMNGAWTTPATLDPTKALGAVNSGSITDPLQTGSPSLGTGLFGETSINLAAAGAFQPGTCEKFGSVFTKARSSGSSFDSELKDFIAPEKVNLSNCQPSVVKLKKVDAHGNPLSGAVMQLFLDKDADDTVSSHTIDAADTQVTPDSPTAGTSDCTTGSDGIGNCVFSFSTTSNNGLYIAHEKTPPPGYLAAPDQATTVTVTQAGQNITLTFTDNPIPGAITITKQDDATPPDPLGGAQFSLYVDPAPASGDSETAPDGDDTTLATGVGANPCTTASTGAGKGTCGFTNVALGNYWVVETTAPSGYAIASPAYQPVTIGVAAGGQVVPLTFTDPVQATLKVVKTDDAGNALSGAVFTLFKGTDVSNTANDTNTGRTCTTAVPAGGTQAVCSFANVGLGSYVISETTTPTGYATAANQAATVTAQSAGQTISLTFVNPVRANIQVIKTDNAGAPLTGAVFELYTGTDVTNLANDTDTGRSCTTAMASGQAVCSFTNLGLGNYVLSETTTPPGHATAPNQATSITAGSAGTTISLTFVDPALAGIRVVKTDDAGNPLAGAVFELYTGTDVSNLANDTDTGRSCTTAIVSGQAVCSFTNLSVGSYVLNEKTTPTGYATAANQTTTITAGNAGQTISLTFVDPVRATLGVIKTDDSTPANNLAGATFVLETSPGGTPITGQTCTTGSNGQCNFPNAVGLGAYIVHETVIPAGHSGAPDQTVTITAANAGQLVQLTFVDPVQATIGVIKTDDSNPANNLSGASFALETSPSGTAIPGQTCTTGSNGQCNFPNAVGLGSYIVHETVIPAGHSGAPDQTVTITAASAGKLVQLTFVDPVQATIGVIKTDDSTPANNLSGATFALETFPAGTPITGQTCTTGSNGQCTFPNAVGLGEYIVHETVIPTGHGGAPDQSVVITAASAGKLVQLTFVDPVQSAIQVVKTDDVGNALAGAVFELYTGSDVSNLANDTDTGLSCTTAIVSGQAVCSFGNLGLGSYVLHEKTTPTGYTSAPNQTTVISAANAGQTITLTFVDPRQFRIIAIVCQQGATNTLYPSQVTLDGGQTLTTISSSQAQALGLSDATVCGLPGATFINQPKGTHSLGVIIS